MRVILRHRVLGIVKLRGAIEFIGVNDLHSHNKITNTDGNVLDLVLSNIPNVDAERRASLDKVRPTSMYSKTP